MYIYLFVYVCIYIHLGNSFKGKIWVHINKEQMARHALPKPKYLKCVPCYQHFIIEQRDKEHNEKMH